MRFVSIAAVVLLFSSSVARCDDEKQSNPNKRAFQRARLAATAETWDAAIAILDKIDTEQVDDVTVIEYVEFSKLCVKTASALGIARNSNPDSPTDVIAKIDWGALTATLAEKALKDPIGFAKLLRDAKKVQDGIPRYLKLAKKYRD